MNASLLNALRRAGESFGRHMEANERIRRAAQEVTASLKDGDASRVDRATAESRAAKAGAWEAETARCAAESVLVDLRWWEHVGDIRAVNWPQH